MQKGREGRNNGRKSEEDERKKQGGERWDTKLKRRFVEYGKEGRAKKMKK